MSHWKKLIIAEELEKTYNSYNKGNYTFGKYATESELVQAFFEGKIFVLKGSNNGFYICLIFPVIIFVAIITSLFVDIPSFAFFLSIGLSILSIPFIVFAIIIKRRFVVIGPSGVYYRKYSQKDFFLWKNVNPSIETKTVRLRYGMTTDITIITIITPNNKKLRFVHGQYKKKEFPFLAKEEMFYRLFQIYFELGKLQEKTKVDKNRFKELNNRILDHLKSEINTHEDSKSEIAGFLDGVDSPEDVEVLLIDVDVATVRLIESFFEAKGHNCKGIAYGESGLYLLRNFLKPKVVLTNIILADMMGYDVCKIIKTDPNLKNIPVIYLTAHLRSEVEKMWEYTKADGYILMPFKFSDFDVIFDLLNSS